MDRNSYQLRAFIRYEIKLSPSHYQLYMSDGVKEYIVATPNSSFEPRPGSRAEQMKNLRAGDSIVFVCDKEKLDEQNYPAYKRAVFEGEIERVIEEIESNEKSRTKIFKFK